MEKKIKIQFGGKIWDFQMFEYSGVYAGVPCIRTKSAEPPRNMNVKPFNKKKRQANRQNNPPSL